MAKFTTLFLVVLLLCSTLAYAARPAPALSANTSLEKTQVEGFEEEQGGVACEGVGEEECLMRRTLAAHIDYIYTQKQKP